jgi:uncharacterized protein (DUF433 family)
MHFDKIWKKEGVCLGKPVIKGTRIKVEFILEKLGQGTDISTLLKDYDHLTKEEILECINYARAVIENEKIELAHA